MIRKFVWYSSKKEDLGSRLRLHILKQEPPLFHVCSHCSRTSYSCSGICRRCFREGFTAPLILCYHPWFREKSLWTRASLNGSIICYQAPGWASKGSWSASAAPMLPSLAQGWFLLLQDDPYSPPPSLLGRTYLGLQELFLRFRVSLLRFSTGHFLSWVRLNGF